MQRTLIILVRATHAHYFDMCNTRAHKYTSTAHNQCTQVHKISTQIHQYPLPHKHANTSVLHTRTPEVRTSVIRRRTQAPHKSTQVLDTYAAQRWFTCTTYECICATHEYTIQILSTSVFASSTSAQAHNAKCVHSSSRALLYNSEKHRQSACVFVCTSMLVQFS